MTRKRCRFSADFKRRVALEALRKRDTVQAIAARHEVHPNQVSAWKRQAVEGLEEVFSQPGLQPRLNEIRLEAFGVAGMGGDCGEIGHHVLRLNPLPQRVAQLLKTDAP